MPTRSRRQPWHAVSVVARGKACAQAQALRNRRFLSAEAPALPLQDCPTAGSCECVYQHHRDRRSGPRRSAETSGVRGKAPTGERRAGRGRREDD